MSKLAGQGVLEAVRSEGGLLPPDILQRIAQNDPHLPGLAAQDYGLVGTETLSERITQSWSRLKGLWHMLGEDLAEVGDGDPATRVTRERFLMPLLEELRYGRLPKASASTFQIEDRSYPISHLYQHTPIHLLGARVPLDRRTEGVPGAATASPHGLLQHFLNSSDAHLWGIVSNGRVLRVLRDHYSLTQQAYVEFDLESIFDGELFHAFRLLWLVCHQSRVKADKAEQCWLEKWFETAREEGVRALDHLREGVEGAIESLGRGFLAHASNTKLKHELASGGVSAQDYYRELLRLVYRLIFLFVAEDREVLLDPHAPEEARARYVRFYSTKRVRELSRRRRGTAHGDLWEGLLVTMDQLNTGRPSLGLPALGSFLWSDECLPHLNDCQISNGSLLEAVRYLSTFRDGKQLYPVNWRNVGSEELGSVYESLLELSPELSSDAATFDLKTKPGHERKTSGSYYTPSSLVSCLLDSALNPVLDDAGQEADPEAALLGLKVCDPASGSGHFLVAAARRIAHRLATVRSGDEEPSPEALRHALRDVVGRCIYGVDINPMAVELCKVSLWMEALEPGKPLSFLDHHIQCGNSLLGTTPALLEQGIPDDAFRPIEGDDNKIGLSLRKQNREEQKGQATLFADLGSDSDLAFGKLASEAADVDTLPDDSPDAVVKKALRWRHLTESDAAHRERLRADTWCAAFVWPKKKGAPEAPTHQSLLRLSQDASALPRATQEEAGRLSDQYRFFHWHLAFPNVFGAVTDGRAVQETTGWTGGFDAVLSNPPWERIKLQEKEFFASRRPDIANASKAALRRRLINELAQEDPALYADFLAARRQAEGTSHFVRNSGFYPLCGRGDVNTYAVFAELMRATMSSMGSVGCIVPSGIATDDTTKLFFQRVVEHGQLASLYEFENEGFFSAGHGHMLRFALTTLVGMGRSRSVADFLFQGKSIADLSDPIRHFQLTADEIALVNPNTHTCPIFRTQRDAQLTKQIYRRVPVLLREGPPEENPWGISFKTLFHMTNDSHLFRDREQLESEGWRLEGNVFVHDSERYLPLYEAKMVQHFDHRFGDYGLLAPGGRKHVLPNPPVGHYQDASYGPLSRYWVPEDEVKQRLSDRWDRGWLIGWRGITDSRASARTIIAAVIPRFGVGNNLPISLIERAGPEAAGLVACLSSFPFDFVSRSKVGGTNLNFFIAYQLPVLPPSSFAGAAPWESEVSLQQWICPRVLELAYTASDLASFARDIGYSGPPFRWDEQRRFLLRCELDAAFFHLYGVARDDVDYIMETFPIVRRNDEKTHGEYRTKRVILQTYDAMNEAIRTGRPYETLLDPPPADRVCAHVESELKAVLTH